MKTKQHEPGDSYYSTTGTINGVPAYVPKDGPPPVNTKGPYFSTVGVVDGLPAYVVAEEAK